MALDRIIDDSVLLFGDGGVFLALSVADRRRQANEMRTAVVTVAVQEHRSAQDDGWTLRAWPEQHRQNAEKEIVTNDDVGWKLPQDLPQAFVLLKSYAVPLSSRSLQRTRTLGLTRR
jgi:hypothetical protein